MENNEPKFIITDPCYVMSDEQYDAICDAGCDFEGQNFPLKSTHKETSKKIVFHTIQGTPYGDGSYQYRGQNVGVDAGMLCIVEAVEGDFSDERFGAKFGTLEQAQSAFPKIIKHF